MEVLVKACAQRIYALLMLAGPAWAFAAAPTVPGPDRLPDDTWVMVNWHGVANADRVRASNPVLKLWHDPQFATAREQIVEQISGSARNEESPAEARAAIEDVLSILENPLVIGVAGDPFARGGDSAHLFGVLNRKGKEAEWTRLLGRQKPRADSVVSTYAFRGTQIKKTVKTTVPKLAPNADPAVPPQPKITNTFEAAVGEYQLYADGQAEIESLIVRLTGSERATSSLLQDPAWQRAQRFRADGPMLEAFIKVPDLTRAPIPATAQMNTAAVVRELHPERIQGLWFSAGMGRDRMPIRAALLGDTSPGSVLDLIGGNVSTFQTLAAAPATEAFTAFRLDLPALYATVLRAAKAGMPPDQGAAIGMMVDSMVMAQTGMLTTRLLGLLTGEIGIVSNGNQISPSMPVPAALLVPLTDGEQLLTVLRKVAGPMMANEEKVSGATLIRLGALPGLANPGAAVENKPFYAAVSPTLLVISSDRVALEGVLARNAAGTTPAAGSLAADAAFRAARRNLPAELNGLTYADFSRMQWEKQVATIQQQLDRQKQQALEQADRVEKGEGDKAPDPARAAELRKQAEDLGSLQKILVEVLPLVNKYLKFSIGGSWKAADGVFFDSFVN
jgi:hypothetical protein